MHISFHLGAHCTDDDLLVKSLLKNKGRLAEEGVIVPGPGRYRKLLSDVVPKLAGQPANRDTQDMLLDAMLDVDEADRLILSHDNFLGGPKKALEGGALYPMAARNTQWLRNLFPDNPVEFFIGLRDPASFVPELWTRLSNTMELTEFLSRFRPHALYWSDVIHAIREANPDCPVTVWCNEDTPLIWKELLHEITGLDPSVALKGGLDVMSRITAQEGMKRLRAYMKTHPAQTEIQRRRILSAFLDKFALDDEIEEEVDLPGWSADLVAEMTEACDDDMLEVKRLHGVTLLTA
ncbi:hypothetical protein [Aliiroseovarius sp.]|uniref:hypothetical protein n=1 Tax=Aliiroseovarius sp. TaxID=1872442 RepID=UPI002621DD3E|nr:hypothetical protein [Aliiroseovarius sp.]